MPCWRGDRRLGEAQGAPGTLAPPSTSHLIVQRTTGRRASTGPMEWCRPVPGEEATALASQYPELTLRTEPAHREAFVALRAGRDGIPGVRMQLASEALRAWAEENDLNPESLTLKPEDLGMRITYLASGPVTETSVPDRDFAVPFA